MSLEKWPDFLSKKEGLTKPEDGIPLFDAIHCFDSSLNDIMVHRETSLNEGQGQKQIQLMHITLSCLGAL